MENVYLFVNSADSLNIFDQNRGGEFKVQLPRSYDLSGSWECALLEITFVPAFRYSTQRVYVCSNVVGNESYVNNSLLPILQSVCIKPEEITEIVFERPLYHKVRPRELSSIEITLRDDRLRVCDTKDDHVFCLLHFRKRL